MRFSKAFSLRWLAAALLFAAGTIAGSSLYAEELSRTDFVLGTVCTVRFIDGGNNAALDEAFARLRTIEEHMSANRDDSELSRVNAMAGKEPVKVWKTIFYVISKALDYPASRMAASILGGPAGEALEYRHRRRKVPRRRIFCRKSLVDCARSCRRNDAKYF